MYADGSGLYLQVRSKTARSWVFRYRVKAGGERYLGLGPLDLVSLAQAREAATDARRLLLAGVDPIEARRKAQAEAELAAGRAVTFREDAEAYIAAHAPGWRNAKHRYQWRQTLLDGANYAGPILGPIPVQEIGVADVLRVLRPIWSTKIETAQRLRGRIEAVLDWAKAAGHREGENPARWRGHLENLLARPSRVTRVRHHPALPYAEVAGFLDELRDQGGIAARALEFTMLTIARTNEVIGATWSEIDRAGGVWTIPGERMKMGREHRVPLTPRTLEILDEMAALVPSTASTAPIFPGIKAGRPLSNMAMLMLLRRMGRSDLTVHGFRSTFTDWCAERTSFPSEVREMALAHSVGDEVEQAYRRGDLFQKRRRLMQAWESHCSRRSSAGGNVQPLRAARAEA